MKRILGLVLALVMVMSAVSAFAAIPSKKTSDITKATTKVADVTVEVTENESAAIVELLTSLLNNTLPEGAKDVLPDGFNTVEEVATMKISGGSAEQELTLNVKFATDFTGKDVAVLLGRINNGVIDEWKSVKATVKAEDGSLDLVLSGDIQNWLSGHEFVMMVFD